MEETELNVEASWVLLEAIKEELELPSDMSKQRAVAEALQRCGLQPSSTIQFDIQAVAEFLEIAERPAFVNSSSDA